MSTDKKPRQQFCSSRVKVSVIGSRLAQTQHHSNVSKDDSISEMQMSSRLWIQNIRRQLRELNARRQADAIRAKGPGGLKANDATYTEADEMHREFLYGELEGGFDSGSRDDNEGSWQSDDDDDRDMGDEESNPLLRMAFLEKEVASARLAAQSRTEKNKHWSRFRTQAQSQAWYGEYDRLTLALMRYEACQEPLQAGETMRSRQVMCLSWEGRQQRAFAYDEKVTLAEALVQSGFLPTKPTIPSLAIAVSVMAMYDLLSRRCASLSIQAFTHSWCDLQGIAFEDHFGHSFSSAFDAYIELRHRIQAKLDGHLYKDELDQYKDICPPCAYKSGDEPDLQHTMLVSVDGNESLKRVRRTKEVDCGNGRTEFVSTERPDFRHRPSFLRIEDTEVDEMKDEVTHKMRAARRTRLASGLGAGKDGEDDCDATESTPPSDEPSREALTKEQASEGCERRWVNMSPDHKNSWGHFDQNGVFICACRHGNVLLRCDMVRSGELAKYPLAIVKRLVSVFGKGIMCGYDIGCDFSKTANRSAKVGPLVKDNNFEFCCGLFHGYAHNRVCQLSWLPLYLPGVGLEDFETCERVFSESNKVAAVTRNASKFHREQWLDRHFARWNSDKFGECSKTIVNNAKQAVGIIADLEPLLADAMSTLQITSVDVFEEARKDELEFLVARQKMQPSMTEARQVDYVHSLRKLQQLSVEALEESERLRFSQGADHEGSAQRKAHVRRLETQHMKKLNEVGALSRHVGYLEGMLGISERWEPGSSEYDRVSKLLDEEQYYRLMDRVEGLVVARLHELSKMNKAGTGVRLRAQIAKALDSRGAAIKSAVRRFNAAGAKLGRSPVDANAAVKYASLGEFELLRMSRHNVGARNWAQPAFRDAQTMHFKLERAREEIQRSKTEARRLVGHIVEWVLARETLMVKLTTEDPLLVPQLQKAMVLRLAQCERHFRRLSCLDAIPAFADIWNTTCNLDERTRVERLFASIRDTTTLPDRGLTRTADDLREQAEAEIAAETDAMLDILERVHVRGEDEDDDDELAY